MIKAVLFDMDGVLVDTEPIHFSSIKKLLEKNLIRIPDTDFAEYIGLSEHAIWKKVKQK